MRLLEFVPCGRPAALPEDSPPRTRRTEENAEAPPLSPTTCAYPDKRRRRPSHGTASPSWRPSLVAISEDGPQAAMAPVAAKGGSGGGASRTRSAKSTGRILPRKERGDYWHHGVSTVVPALAPTPFLF
ncbi:uncharacterized protein LOC103695912 [Phoenix dactylifera]|uniref:Uncharacterized protein LOC103695912 n=1 Tax=Phoenix dactylifera TaxID=42345 RepID=A0A8B7BFZ1_PHODC|nr:uncharacterized protein LOC103695912 [Phoenix dactylifera]